MCVSIFFIIFLAFSSLNIKLILFNFLKSLPIIKQIFKKKYDLIIKEINESVIKADNDVIYQKSLPKQGLNIVCFNFI